MSVYEILVLVNPPQTTGIGAFVAVQKGLAKKNILNFWLQTTVERKVGVKGRRG